MKILKICTMDQQGGAARAAYRLHRGLIEEGVNSQMLVQYKQSEDPTVRSPYNTAIEKFYARLRPKINSLIQLLQKTKNPILHSSNILPSGFHKKINNTDADIVHLHWVNKEMISIGEIAKIQKPIIWTLHDMWAFCGAEHVDDLENPGRYIAGYCKSSRPKSYNGIDIDRWTWNRKVKKWDAGKFDFVTPSSWLAKCLYKSKLFKGKEAAVIPNGLDTSVFKPHDQKNARERLGLALSKKIVLYGAMGAESEPNKGYNKFNRAIEFLKQDYKTEDLLFLVFGGESRRIAKHHGITTKFFGKIENDEKLALIYSAADVMVVPSLIEAFGQTASEAMASGTPVVAFKTSGLKDIVDHKESGYLANPYKSDDLARGIEWIISDRQRNKKLADKAIDKAFDEFDIKKVTREYISFYKDVLEK